MKKSPNKKRLKRVAYLFLAIFALLTSIYNTLPTRAANAIVFATKDAVYEKLEQAAKLNVITAAMKNCMTKLYEQQESAISSWINYGISDETWSPMSGRDMKSANLFSRSHSSMRARGTAVWYDELIIGGSDRYDGKFSCHDRSDNGDIVFKAFLNFVGQGTETYDKVLCNGGYPNLIQRWSASAARQGGSKDAGNINTDCDMFNDSAVEYGGWYGSQQGYIIASNWEDALKKIYENHTDKQGNTNPYLPAWEDVGTYGNIDGYFSYMLDFGKKCSSAVDQVYREENNSSHTYPATTFERESTKIIIKRRWYHLGSDPSWSASLSVDNPTKSCSALLERMDFLRSKYNGVGNDRGHGYQGIIIALLDDTCKNLQADTCETDGCYWDKVLEAAQTIIDNPSDYTADQVSAAQADKAKIENAKNVTHQWYETSGEETDEDGKIYQCLVTTTGDIQQQTTEDPTDTITEEPQEEEEKENCYTKSGTLGWIICPIVDGARTAIIQSYGSMVEPALRINPELFKAMTGKLNGTYNAWNIFRVIGNIVFVVMFVLVILSQVTSYKVEKYGVKNTLPKLIITAIILNLSFIICQGAIDLCNITGKGVGNLLQSITKQVGYPETLKFNAGGETTEVKPTDEGSWQDTNTWGASFAKNWLGNSSLIILVAGIGVGVILSQGFALLIPICMMLITVLVAVLGLVAILGVRQALAVLLVAISPVAIACYILPNTKGLFNKWFKTFQGLLLAYPICSALVYAGDMCATLLLQVANSNPSNNFWLLISAAAVSVAPIFIIPKVLRKSMTGMTNGFAKLSQRLGGYTKGQAKQRMENSALTNRRNYNQLMRNQMRSAQLSKFSAKRGRRTIQRPLGRLAPRRLNAFAAARLANGKWMPNTMRRKYNASQNSISAYTADATKAYSSSFAGVSDADITTRLLGNVKKGKIRDPNMIVAGLSAIHDEDKLTAAVMGLAKSGALEELRQTDTEAYHRIGDVLESRRNSIINQSMGKLMNANEGVQQMWADGSLAKEVQSAGTGIMASQDKDVFATEGASQLFSIEQKAAAIASNPTGGKATNIAKMEEHATDDELIDIAKALGTKGVKNLNTSEFEVKMKNEHTGQVETKVMDGTLAILGRGDAKKGAEIVKAANPEAIEQLNSEAGREVRPDMDQKAAGLLGVKSGGEQSDGVVSSGSISSGIDINNMTESEQGYMEWQMEKNPAGANLDKEVEIQIAHPTAPDLHDVEDTGDKRDEHGKVIGKRAAEGDRKEYHPVKEGQSDADHEEYEKELGKLAEKYPKKPEETSLDYYARLKKGMKSFDRWIAEGKGEMKIDDDKS